MARFYALRLLPCPSGRALAIRAATYDVRGWLAVVLLQYHIEPPQLVQVLEHLVARLAQGMRLWGISAG